MNKRILKGLQVLMLSTLSLIFLAQSVSSQTTKTVGTGGNYTTLKSAFDAINAGTITGAITLQIISSTAETVSAVLNASGSGSANFSSVLIYPLSSGLSISNSGNVESLIHFNGADNVTIDGRVNQSGSADLIITNSYASGNSRTFAFLNDASGNTIKYCTVKGSSTGTGRGIIHFSTSNLSTGNDNNIIDRCNITNSGTRPLQAIYSLGSMGKENSGNIISNNYIYDFFSASFSSSYGISIAGASTDFIISGNSFYETAVFAPASGNNYNAIRVLSNTNHTISNNYIGGRAPNCGGSAMTVSANSPHYFCGIMVSGGTSGATLVENNVISNIDYTSTQSNPWDGIFIHAGNVNVYGNTIGATTGTGSIIIRTPCASASATISGGVVQSIVLNGGGSGYSSVPVITFSTSGSTASAVATANLTDGVVTSITLVSGGSGYTSVPSVFFDASTYSTSHGMINNSSGTVNISNNNTGSITTVGNDYYSHGFESIYVRGGPSYTTISNNLYGSLTTANSMQTSSSAVSSLIKQDIYGIYSANTGTTIISGNIIANLTNNYSGTNTGTRTRGIQTTYGTNTIQNNTVRNLTTSSKQSPFGSNASLIGISQTSNVANQIITGNTIHSLTNLTSGSDKVELYGIYYSGSATGTNIISENFIHSLSLSNTSTTSMINGIVIFTGTSTFANNIINLGTDNTTGYGINGIWDENGTNNIYFNIVYIGGTATGTTSSTSALWNKTSNSTRNYRNNILFNARSGGTSGSHYAIRLAGTTNLTINYNDYFVNGTGGILGFLTTNKTTLADFQTATGQDGNSLNINPNFNSAGGTIPQNYYSSESMPGISGTGITLDYYSSSRGATPKMGALEGITGYIWVGSISTDFATAGNWVGGIVPPEDASISFSNSPLNNCVLDGNKSLGNITIAEGTYKLVLNSNQLTIKGNLNFTNGAQIDATASSSSVVFNGTSSQILHSGDFYNNSIGSLTLNNSSGLTLNSDLIISNSLNLTAGTLTLGTSNLSVALINSTSGNLDASNTSANLIFNNSNPLTLPSSLFTGSINNITITGSGGITASNDITVNGILSLQSSNPSATKGLLDMGNYTLNMGASATAIGTGDVEGIVRREHTFIPETQYTFGSQYTTFTFVDGNLKPTWIICKITIGAIPGWSGWSPNGKVSRYYNVAASNNSSTSIAVINMRYLLSELDGTYNDESKLVFWHKYVNYSSGTPHEHGKSNQDFINHTIGVTGLIFGSVATTNPAESEVAIAYPISVKNEWNGGLSGYETVWGNDHNWSAGRVPLSTDDVLIPTGKTYYPSLTKDDNVVVNSIEISSGASITANTFNITISGSGGAWMNNGTFNPGTGKVLFTHGVLADIVTVSGTTNFYNIECGANTTMQPVAGCTLRIAGNGTAYETSVVDFSTVNNTVEYNGAGQTIVNPNGIGGNSGYYNLIFSGSGIKAMPTSNMTINGNLTLSGTATVTAASALTIGGNLNIAETSTFNTGNFDHTIGGNFENNGSFTAAMGKTITMNGGLQQWIGGSTSIDFGNLTINNKSGVTIYSNVRINNNLTLTNGNLGVGPTLKEFEKYTAKQNKKIVSEKITNTKGGDEILEDVFHLSIIGDIVLSNGYKIEALTNLSEIEFAGSSAQTIPADAFVDNKIYALKINNSAGVTLSSSTNVNGTLTLTSGKVTTGANVLTLGSSISSLGTLSPATPTSTSYVVGNFERWFDESTVSDVFFPVGTATHYLPAIISYTVAPTTGGKLKVSARDDDPLADNIENLIDDGYIIDRYSNNAWWQFSTSTLTGGTYSLNLKGDGITGASATNYTKLRMLKRETGDQTWGLSGTHVDATGSYTSPLIKRTGLTGFSEFGIGGFSGDGNTLSDNPLPVVLSSLSSSVINRNVKLNWTTSTETNNSGFEVERAEVRSQNLEFSKIGFINGHGTANTPTSYSFEDKNLQSGKYKYRLKQIDYNGSYEYFELNGEIEVGVPKKFDMSQNYPNPFNPVTKINFDLPENGLVNIRLYDMLGREVAVIVNEVRSAGYHTVQFDASKLSSGIYFYKMNSGKFNGIKKMSLIK